MDRRFFSALTTGCERVAAWADLLDEINVFPVADSDTGRNLVISLAPLTLNQGDAAYLGNRLVEAATGNSGNIAAAFLRPFLAEALAASLGDAIAAGRHAAWQAVAEPMPGTMLTVFDALAQATYRWPAAINGMDAAAAIDHTETAVRSTVKMLPQLQRAHVVDSGALGIFIFFEGFLCGLTGKEDALRPVTDRFAGLLEPIERPAGNEQAGYCVNTILRSPGKGETPSVAQGLGESVVAVADGDRLRLHLHTGDHRRVRTQLESFGEILDWQVESLESGGQQQPGPAGGQRVHVMTDAAGSLSRDTARDLGVTLLDSKLVIERCSIPETLFEPQALYAQMAAGKKVSTAQASTFQKHQSYESALGRYPQVLYLAVGSVYTGNVAAASGWRDARDLHQRLAIVDTGAASGRLGLIVRLVAAAARRDRSLEALVTTARQAIQACGELIFLDQLKYLAAGGRISRSKGFFGDLLGIKPVISPEADGAANLGSVRKRADQVPFALNHLQTRFAADADVHFLLQYSDNEKRVREAIWPQMAEAFPGAQIEICPLSLTSGAHMGPGTWGIAFGPRMGDNR